MIRQVVYRGITLGRRGVYGYSINTELRSQGATPRRTPRIGVFHTNVRNQDKDYAGYPQAHRASLRTVALTEYASRDVFLKILNFLKVCSRPKFAQDAKYGLRSGRGVPKYVFFEGEHVDIPILVQIK